MLQPRRTKYRKSFKPKPSGFATAGNTLAFGEFGLASTEPGRLSSKQLESARRAVTHYIKRGGRLWIRVFPDRPITKKPPETRMGGGKGDLHEYVAPVKSGTIVLEMSGISETVAREALRLAGHKLSVKSIFLKRD